MQRVRRLKAPSSHRRREKPRVETPMMRARVPRMESLSLQRLMRTRSPQWRGVI